MQTDIPGGPTLVGVALLSGLRDIIENTCTRTDHYTDRQLDTYNALVVSRRPRDAKLSARAPPLPPNSDTENRYARIFTMFSARSRDLSHHVRISIGQYT